MRLSVQVKRYKRTARVTTKEINNLRSRIPNGEQGAFITTGGFQKKALHLAAKEGFAPIGTVDGKQLVEVLTDRWDEIDLPGEMRQKLKLRRALVPE